MLLDDILSVLLRKSRAGKNTQLQRRVSSAKMEMQFDLLISPSDAESTFDEK